MAIVFTREEQPEGFEWLSTCSDHKILYRGKTYDTAEVFFYAMRYWGTGFDEDIRKSQNAQIARLKCRLNQRGMVVQPFSDKDVMNLWTCLLLKLHDHPQLVSKLLATGDQQIIEDVTDRPKSSPWGCRIVAGKYVGENIYGRMWSKLREKIKTEIPFMVNQLLLEDSLETLKDLFLQNLEIDPTRNHLLQFSRLKRETKLKYLSNLIEIPHTIEPYQVEKERVRCNLIAVIEGASNPEKKVLVTAHHDTVNLRSDNCLDNNASVMNLVRLMNSVKNPKCTVIFAITDGEETCDLEINGISQILEAHKIDQHLDLELTSCGDIPVISTYNDFELIQDAVEIEQPPNSALMMSEHENHPRGSACITLMDAESLEEIEENGFCYKWTHCHQMTDTMDRWYNNEDCDKFVAFLTETISNYE